MGDPPNRWLRENHIEMGFEKSKDLRVFPVWIFPKKSNDSGHKKMPSFTKHITMVHPRPSQKRLKTYTQVI